MEGNSGLQFFGGVVGDVPSHEFERFIPRTDGLIGARQAHGQISVGFFLTGSDPVGYVLAERLIESVHRHMPEASIVQLTDMDSPAVTPLVRRKPTAALSVLRSLHYSECEGNWLLVDTDVVIEKDVSHVFDMDFDVAVADRNWPHLPNLPEDFTEQMPYCAGVVFSKCAAFWIGVHSRVKLMEPKEQSWFGDQRAIAMMIRSGQWKHIVLPGSTYQYPPLNDEIGDAAITHWKGPERKKALFRRIHKEWGLTIPV